MRSKNSHSSRFRLPRSGPKIILSFIFVTVCVVVLFFILLISNTIVPDRTTSQLLTLWENGNYSEVADLTDTLLDSEPLNSNYLFYNGVSYFYSALSQVNTDEQLFNLDNALYSLRKLLYAPPIGYESRIHYILGKIYFYKGPFYYDLASEYLTRASQASLDANDIPEYLGVIYLETEQPEAGIKYLLKAIENDPKDILYYTIANAYEDISNYDQSLVHYQLCLDNTIDNILIQKSFIGRARILFKLENFDQAKDIFQKLIDDNTQLADAYFYLGEIYALENDLIKARANWRAAYNQDNTFTPALERLNS
ncbi:MAG: tetratricopeptide repeat protein [Salinispira sp.]